MSQREGNPQPADPARRKLLEYGLPFLGPFNANRARTRGDIEGPVTPEEIVGAATTGAALGFLVGGLRELFRLPKEVGDKLEMANRISDQVLSIDHLKFRKSDFERIVGEDYDPEILAHGVPSLTDFLRISPQAFESMARDSKITFAAVVLSGMFTDHAKITRSVLAEDLGRILNVPSRLVKEPKLGSIDKALILDADTNSLGIDMNLHVSAEYIAQMISEQDKVDIANGKPLRSIISMLQVGTLKVIVSNKRQLDNTSEEVGTTYTISKWEDGKLVPQKTKSTKSEPPAIVPDDVPLELEYLDNLSIEIIEPYSPLLPGELQKEGLLEMVSLAKKFPDKLFFFTAGNFNSDFGDLREELEKSGNWAENIVLVGAAFPFEAAYKPSERLTGSRGADFYLEVPSRSSSEATAVLTTLAAVVKDQNPEMSPRQIIQYLQKYSEEFTLVRKGLITDTYGIASTLNAEGEITVYDIPDEVQLKTYEKDDYDFIRFQGRRLDAEVLRNDLMKAY